MPYQIPRPRVRRNLYAALSVALLSVILPAAASACTVATAGESQAFQSAGDSANYTLVPGSTFASGATGWALSNAAVTGKLASLVFDGASNTSAVLINPGGSAVSPPVCVSNATPTFRFFTLGTGGFSSLTVNLLWNDMIGLPQVTPVGTLSGNGSWTASPALRLGSALPLWMPGSTLSVRLQFEPIGSGSWAINSLYIDPYSRG